MQRFDRYVLSQLFVLFGFFALVLVSVYWVNRAVVLFDRLIADGHAASVFVEFTLLSLPAVVALVLPMAAFAATVYVTNRMSNEAELTVMQSAGQSPWRMARPYLAFGVLVMLMSATLTHVIVPTAQAQYRDRSAELSASVSARILREGDFLHPVRGVTLYMREISPEGTLRDLLLSDRRDPTREVTFTAEEAYLVQDADGTKLLMVSGTAQVFDGQTGRLSTTAFEELTHDVSALIAADDSRRVRIETVDTAALLFEPERIAALAETSVGVVVEETHRRIQEPILSMVAAMIGYAALIGGAFSRFGVSRRIIGAILALVLVKALEGAVTDPVQNNPMLWPLTYTPSLFGFAIAGVLLFQAARHRLWPWGAAA